jgi:NAD+ dependent glucose-6-phosphate dehydrogenase
VVHLAASADVDAPWEELLANNIVGTHNVFGAAARAGVDCVVFASSNHVIGMYESEGAPQIYELDDRRVYDHRVEIRPDSAYGVSKAYGEAIGRYYMELRGLRVFCLRIGWVSEEDRTGSRPAANLLSSMTKEQRLRVRAVWQSQRDCAQLIARCLQATAVRWAIVYGISNNRRQFWDLSHARRLLNYEPRDTAPGPASSRGEDR